jgi:predicted tellurium resistance membrane protein TerC
MVAIIVKMTDPVIRVLDQGFSWRDLILFAGGLFLIGTGEIHHTVDRPRPDVSSLFRWVSPRRSAR